MTSNSSSEISLPCPDITSPQFTEQVEALLDAFDNTINALMERLSRSKKVLEEIQAEIDEMNRDEDEDIDEDEEGDDEDNDADDEDDGDDEGDEGDDDTTLAESDNELESNLTEGLTHLTYLEENPQGMDQQLLRLEHPQMED
jgi:hypothetical protein